MEHRRPGFGDYKPQIVISGTAQDRDDLYHELLRNEGFFGLKQKAIIDIEKGEVLWPERYDIAALLKIKMTVGEMSFSKEYQNEPLIDDAAIFPPSLFEPLKDGGESYAIAYDGDENMSYLGCDFSVPGDIKGDWTVYTVISKDKDMNYRVIGYWRAQPKTLQEQLDKIVEMCRNFNISLGYLEANLFQKIYAEQLRLKTDFPLRGHVVTKAGKNSPTNGVLAMRVLMENGKILWPYKTPLDKAYTDLWTYTSNHLTMTASMN